jgi:hypothetical protein
VASKDPSEKTPLRSLRTKMSAAKLNVVNPAKSSRKTPLKKLRTIPSTVTLAVTNLAIQSRKIPLENPRLVQSQKIPKSKGLTTTSLMAIESPHSCHPVHLRTSSHCSK